ncbi:hypothetical protein ACP70R_045768 [Stipagrostis hirtigluma subsp. patula]
MIGARFFPGGKLWWWILFLCCGSSSSSRQTLIAAAEDRVVTHLPGFEGPLPFHLQTGYVEVDDVNGVRLFYYFIRSERSPANDPLTLWLSGGPGCTAFTALVYQIEYVEVDDVNGVRLFYYFIRSERSPANDPLMLWLSGGPGCTAFTALVYQIGPLRFDLHDYMDGVPKLVYEPESWTKEGYKSSDSKAVSQIVIFLRKWFDEHPEFLSNPLYIGGDSYAGIIVPTVTSEIARSKHVGSKPALNLKGYLAGNAFVDYWNIDGPARIPYAHRMGLISDEIYEAYKKSCIVGDRSHRSVQCANSLDAIDECVKDIFPFHILEPNCAYASPHPYNLLKPKLTLGVREMLQLQDYSTEGLHLSEISTQCRTGEYTLSRLWANDATVREALGIHKGTVPSWLRCNTDIPYSRDIQSSVKYHLDVTTKGYRSLVYSGDHDMAVPFSGTQSWIKSLNFSVVDGWRPWYVDGQVAGYTTSYSNNLTFATVKGAGHTAPEYMPTQCLAMLSRWLAGDPL